MKNGSQQTTKTTVTLNRSKVLRVACATLAGFAPDGATEVLRLRLVVGKRVTSPLYIGLLANVDVEVVATASVLLLVIAMTST